MTSEVAPEPLPESPISDGLRRLILVGAVITTGAGTLSTALLPYLTLKQPLILLLLSSDGRNLVLVVSQLDLWTILAVAVPRRALAMSVTYGLGLVYGRKLLAWSEKKAPRITKVMTAFERLFVRFSRPLLLVWPAYMTNLLAGISRMRWWSYFGWMVVGQVAYVLVSYYVGDLLARWVNQLISLVSRYVWESTAVCAVLVGLAQLFSSLRKRRVAARAAARPALALEAADVTKAAADTPLSAPPSQTSTAAP